MKFLCSSLSLGKAYIDDTNDDDANNDARRTKHDCIRLFG